MQQTLQLGISFSTSLVERYIIILMIFTIILILISDAVLCYIIIDLLLAQINAINFFYIFSLEE